MSFLVEDLMEHKIALRELCFIISFLHVAGLGS